MSPSSLRARLPNLFSGRMGAVLSAAIVVWGLTLFDLTLLPRAPFSFLPVYPPERLSGVRVSADSAVLTEGSPSSPNLWVVSRRGKGARVMGAHLPSFHNPKRPQTGVFGTRLRTLVPDLEGATPVDVATWRGRSPALFAVSSARRDPTLEVYSLDRQPRLLLSAKPPVPPQASDRRDFALARWSGPLPDLYVIDRNAQRREPKRRPSFRPWAIRVYSGESGFQERVHQTLIRPRLSRRLSKYEWWVDVGQRHGKKPDIVLVTRELNTGSHRTEIHLLTGSKRYRRFDVHAATELPQRVGVARPFVFQSDRRGGAVLMVKQGNGELVVRALPLP